MSLGLTMRHYGNGVLHELIWGTQMDVRSSVICDRPKSGPWSRIYGSVTGPTLMGRSNLGAEPILMHGVAPHMCDESSATLLGGEAGGRSPALPLDLGTWCRCTIRAAPAWPDVPFSARSLSPGMRRSLCASNAARPCPVSTFDFEPTHVARTACPRAACRLRTAGGRTVDNAGADTNLTARRAEPGR